MAKVRDILVDVLSVDEDEVTDDAILTTDLGAESIDFLDILFRLEKEFGIKIPQEQLFNRDIVSNAEYLNDRKLNAAGVAALKKAMPYANLTDFEKNPDIDKLADVFTVAAIVNFVEGKVNNG
ncbi:MAG: acyl carrier protein [Phycisphaerales bacterium]|nr:acyl carrier protein [Phycisphaerales bacterium]